MDTRLDPRTLADIAVGLACAEPLWRTAVVHDAGERHPVRLLATDEYEAWVIGWLPGQGLDLHDHGESSGVLIVVDGALDERSVVDGDVVDEVLQAGRVRWLPPGLVHGVTGAGDAPATSIHVYSPPISHMTRFDDDLLPRGVDLVEPEPPLLDPSVLHPAGRG